MLPAPCSNLATSAVLALGTLAATASPSAAASSLQTIRSRPDLRPPKIEVLRHSAGTAAGDIFLTPRAASPTQRTGPLILDSRGRALFEQRVPKGQSAVAFQVQRYHGQRVLTWSQRPAITGGNIYAGNPKQMVDVVMNDRYQVVRKIQARGAGARTDLHDFILTPRDNALVLGYRFVNRDLRKYGGEQHGQVVDALVQIVSLKTGKTLFSWSAIDHVPLSDSIVKAPKTGGWDYFHVNSVNLDTDGQLIVSARHTSTIYKIGHRKGQILWRLGGKRSSFKMGTGAHFFFQHDARIHGSGISIFDNGASDFDKRETQSRVIFLKLDRRKRTATLARQILHPNKGGILARSQGNGQLLGGGHVFVGWGASPAFSEFGPTGKLLFDARVPSGLYQSYRAVKQSWTGHPSSRPVLASVRASGRTAVYASWNGATAVAAWRVLGGPSSTGLTPVGRATWSGLETRISATGAPAYVSVQALNAKGQVIGTSKAAKVKG